MRIQTIGLYGVYALGAILYLACAALVLPVAFARPAPRTGASLLTLLGEGWRFARTDWLIVGALVADSGVGPVATPIEQFLKCLGKLHAFRPARNNNFPPASSGALENSNLPS